MMIGELQKKLLPALAPEDFFILLSHITGKDKAFLLAHPEYEPSKEQESQLKTYCERRLNSEPVAYILGHKEFYGRDFEVTGDTLIPRPETELLVESVLSHVQNMNSVSHEIDIIDIGTGSGCIIITLATELKQRKQRFFGIDISEKAIAIAKRNAEHHHVDSNIVFLHNDLLREFEQHLKKSNYLIITANLPYLSSETYAATEKNVKEYEPKSALFSEREGLDHYYRLLDQLKSLPTLYSSLVLFFEISPEQTPRLRERIKSLFPGAHVSVALDLSGRERLVKAIL